MNQLKGFTIIEILIVVGLIGLLASIVLVSLIGSRERALVASYKAQVHSIQVAAVRICDDTVIVLGANLSEPTSGTSYIDTMALGLPVQSCTPTGVGTFNIALESVDLGTGATATACETNGGTIIDANGVTFPAGC